MAEKNTKGAEKPAGKSGEKAEVRGPEGGRWRGGLHFTPEARIIDLGELAPEDFEAICDDPLLSVKRL